jgi:hypothetical protein
MTTDPFHLGSTTPYYYPSILIYNDVIKIVNGQSPVVILNKVSTEYLMAKVNEPYQSSLRFISLLSRVLTKPDNTLLPLQGPINKFK